MSADLNAFAADSLDEPSSAAPHCNANCGFRWVIDAAGLVLVAAAAAAGVLLVAGGCAPPPPQAGNGLQMSPPPAASPNVRSPNVSQTASGRLRPSQTPTPDAQDGALFEEEPPATPPPAPRVPPRRPSTPSAKPTNPPAASAAANRPEAAVPPTNAPATPTEARLVRQAEADAMISHALAPPTAVPTGGPGALRVADRAVAPLTDSLAAIESAQRVVVDNLRNLETPGYKASRTAIGEGKNVANQIDLTQGDLQPTQRALDVAIQGDGFLQILIYTPESPTGTPGYTRNGSLHMSRQGELVVGQADGYRLMPPVVIPPNTVQLAITQEGKITATVGGQGSAAGVKEIGQLKLIRFTDPTALRPLGGGIYVDSEASGQPIVSAPNDAGAGAIVQGHLEASNVDLVRERMRLRFLQGWRAAIVGSLDGETPKSPAVAVPESGTDGTIGLTSPRVTPAGR